MRNNYQFAILLLSISFFTMLSLGIYIIKIDTKTKLHYLLLTKIFLVSSVTLIQILMIMHRYITGDENELLAYLYLTGLIFLPIIILYLGFVYSETDHIGWKFIVPLVTQIITFFILITNNYHKLFVINYSYNNKLMVFGDYFKVHILLAYSYVLIALFNFLNYSIRNFGIFSKQSISIFLGFSPPFIVSIIVTFKLMVLPTYSTAITFTFTAICLFVAILKFKFLHSMPFAMNLIYDTIEDSIIIIDKNFKLIESNKKFKLNFSDIIDKNQYLAPVKTFKNMVYKLKEHIKDNVEILNLSKFETSTDDKTKFLMVELIPFINKRLLHREKYYLIVIKDITEIKNLNKKIIQQDKLSTLGILSAGIAHDINNPASAIESGLYFLENTFNKYLLENDLRKKEQLEKKIKESISISYTACKNILSIVSSIKNQTRNLGKGDIKEFAINDLIEDVLLILKHKFKNSNCKYEFIRKKEVFINGDYAKLSQVVANVVINAIEAYENKPGIVKILLEFDKNNNAIIQVSDKAGGIKNKKLETIFNDIISTKKNGTGLGLYISNKIITGDFDGKICFDTIKDIGTKFSIYIPNAKLKTCLII